MAKKGGSGKKGMPKIPSSKAGSTKLKGGTFSPKSGTNGSFQ